ncbi:MAG: hypothetical protein BWY36_00232 [Candidatus Diapherotrites archaeon ADurb.Bin253]|jgi:hypothetical protein|nr:MAG: hypothetical protein BWY36_00232 [Candidatus Diapherotrites archaeon ADurb.Bin253]HNZ52175.1 hypothetical protein [Candidatus Pacearchaeota archaeon]HOC96740.1 hypothetical protein [Candidatus Pacearchaeota archaeon]HOH04288.1 hypothetical protein [Candidatus Pacearchaeota archaeon]HOU79470.1 hypothetical protein [Candidatus Pacearchaeota archaeon]
MIFKFGGITMPRYDEEEMPEDEDDEEFDDEDSDGEYFDDDM